MVKNQPANAGDMGLTPGPERSHMPGENQAHAPHVLSPGATTTEVRTPCAPQKKPVKHS